MMYRQAGDASASSRLMALCACGGPYLAFLRRLWMRCEMVRIPALAAARSANAQQTVAPKRYVGADDAG